MYLIISQGIGAGDVSIGNTGKLFPNYNFFGMKSKVFQILPMMPPNPKHLQYATFPVCRNQPAYLKRWGGGRTLIHQNTHTQKFLGMPLVLTRCTEPQTGKQLWQCQPCWRPAKPRYLWRCYLLALWLSTTKHPPLPHNLAMILLMMPWF